MVVVAEVKAAKLSTCGSDGVQERFCFRSCKLHLEDCEGAAMGCYPSAHAVDGSHASIIRGSIGEADIQAAAADAKTTLPPKLTHERDDAKEVVLVHLLEGVGEDEIM